MGVPCVRPGHLKAAYGANPVVGLDCRPSPITLQSTAWGACTARLMAIGGGTWSTVCVNAWLTGLIGVAGTLLGSVTTYLFQSRDARRDQEFRREERLQQEQLNSCSAFAGDLSELKQRLIALWFQNRRDPHGADTQKMATECDRAGASAETARFRVQLISGDPDLMALADAAFAALEPIRRAAFREGEPTSSTPSEPPRLRGPLVSWLVPGPPRQRRLKGSVPRGTDESKLGPHETSFETAVKEFIKAASAQLRPPRS